MGSSRHTARSTGGPSRRGPGTSQPFRPAGMPPTLSRDRAPAFHTRRRALRLLAALALAAALPRARADTIPVVSARLEEDEGDLVLSQLTLGRGHGEADNW